MVEAQAVAVRPNRPHESRVQKQTDGQPALLAL
jgi:hypothetical protein